MGTQPADRCDPWPAPAGWFGKIPALGDFAARRLPPEFTEPWDLWLSDGLLAAREALGAGWLESYTNAPLWRFALMPGALDSRHWFGVLMPSVDRVGRQYPLTIASGFAPQIGIAIRWWTALIEVAMRVRQPGCNAETLEAELLALADRERACPAEDSVDSQVASALASARPGTTLWWPWRGHTADSEALSVLDGLPRAEQLVKLWST
jgi:type VI secretion system protein ImpM